MEVCRFGAVVDLVGWPRLLVPDADWFFRGVWALVAPNLDPSSAFRCPQIAGPPPFQFRRTMPLDLDGTLVSSVVIVDGGRVLARFLLSSRLLRGTGDVTR